MDKIDAALGKRKPGVSMHIVICVLAIIPMYLLANTYTKQITTKENEESAIAATICFITGIYCGRFISQFWISKTKEISNWLLVLVALIIIACCFSTVLFATSLLSHHELFFILLLSLSFFILSVSVGLFIKLVRTKIYTQLQAVKIDAAQSRSELHLLQSQLSPHFLFNTLNNLYGISLSQHEKIPTLLLKLSELLRYSVYDAKEIFVPLKDELNYLNNYIDFEKIRIGDRLELTTELEDVNNTDIKIAPLLLIVFVENAFKHSKNTNEAKIYIHIALKTWGNSILFSVKNSHKNDSMQNDNSSKNSGLGLANVQARLELLYLKEYDLKIEEDALCYNVMLRLSGK